MEKFCQSCAMPLIHQQESFQGTEADQSPSNKYCKYCYQNGVLLNPDFTFQQMVDIGRKGIDKSEHNKFLKAILKWSYPMQLKKMERWKKN